MIKVTFQYFLYHNIVKKSSCVLSRQRCPLQRTKKKQANRTLHDVFIPLKRRNVSFNLLKRVNISCKLFISKFCYYHDHSRSSCNFQYQPRISMKLLFVCFIDHHLSFRKLCDESVIYVQFLLFERAYSVEVRVDLRIFIF